MDELLSHSLRLDWRTKAIAGEHPVLANLEAVMSA